MRSGQIQTFLRAGICSKRRRAASILAAAAVLSGSGAMAATDTWTGTAGGGLWSTPGNWSPVVKPASADSLIFTSALGTGTAALTDDDSVTSFAALTFNSGSAGYTISAGGAVTGLTLTGTLSDASASNSTQTFNLGVTGAALTMTGGTTAVTQNNLIFNNNSSFTSFTDSDFIATGTYIDTLQIAATKTLTFSNGFTFQSATAGTATLDMSAGGGSLVVSGGGLSLGVSAVSVNDTLILPGGSNSITGATIAIGGQPSGSNTGLSTLKLGSGSNTINATDINLGFKKGSGSISFATAAGSITIAGSTGGSSAANITLGNTNNTGSRSSSVNSLLLAGHSATVTAATVTLGSISAAATGGTDNATITFDNGTFTAANIEMGVLTTASSTPTVASFTLGTNSNSTGMLNVNGLFYLANSTVANTTSGTFTINGGTANIATDIIDNSTAGTRTTTVNLATAVGAGGTLSMGDGTTNHQIGSASVLITAFNMPAAGNAATIQNLGGAGIYASGGTGATGGSGGLTMGGAGTLILAGTNTYTGPTSVSAGTLKVTGTTSSSSIFSISGGTLNNTGSIGGAVTMSNGTILGTSTLGGLLSMSGGTLTSGAATGATTGTLTLAGGLSMTGGTLSFNIGTSSSNMINVTGGSVAWSGAAISVGLGGGASPSNANPYTILTSSSPLPTSGLSGLNSTVTIGRTTLTPEIDPSNPDNLIVIVGGGPASLIWRGDNVAGPIWDSGSSGTQNWNNTTQPLNPDVFFDGDNVTFDNTGNKTVTLNTTVSPGSVAFTNTSGAANNYTVSGTGAIAGTSGITLSGGGTVFLQTTNSYTGNTTISNGGTLSLSNLAATGTNSAIGSAGSIIFDGGTLQWTGAASQSTNHPISITPNGATFDASPTASGQAITFSGPITMTGSGARTITLTGTDASLAGQSISTAIGDGAGGATSLVKNGTGSWTLASANSYSGGTTINAGRLRATNVGAFGSGSVTVVSGAQAYLNITGIFPNNFFISGTGVDPAGAIRMGSSGSNLSGTITLNADSRITANGATTGLATISGPITGNHNLEFGNGGGTTVNTIVLSNVNNNWGGNTTISFGTVRVNGTSGPTSGVIPHGSSTGNVFINGGTGGNATLDLNGLSLTINGLNSSGTSSQDFITNGSTTAAAAITVGDNNASGTYAGIIQDGASKSTAFGKIGSGTQTLSANNTYTGATTVSGGTLTVLSTGSIANSAAINVGSGATLDVTDFTAGGGFNIGSSAAQSLVVGGTVNGLINLTGGNATLAGGSTGSLTGTVNVASGSNIHPGSTASDGSIGTLNINTLNVNGGDFRIDTAASNISDQVDVTGTATFGGAATVTVAGTPTAGVFTILQAGTLSNAPADLSLSTLSSGRFNFALDFSQANKVLLDVTGGPASLVWNNSSPNTGDGVTWDVSGNQNWKNAGNPDVFQPSDNVIFNDSNNGNYTVNIGASVTPGSVLVNNSAGDYVFNGSAIAGAIGLTKSGTRKLTVNAANTYTGVTTISGGILSTATIGNGGVAGGLGAASNASANIVLDGGTLQWTPGATITIDRGFTLSPNGGALDLSPAVGAVSVTINGAIATSGTGSRTLTLTGTDVTPLAVGSQTLGGSIGDPSGGQTSIVKTGSIGFTLNAANSYTGGTTINQGRIRTGNAGAYGTGPVVVNDDGIIHGQAYLGVAGTYPNNFTIAGIGPAETGTTVPNNYGALRLGANSAIISGTVTVAADNTRITGRSATGAGGTITGQITGGHSLEFGNSGVVGVLTLSNTANNWAGDTTVSLGTLKAGASSTTTTGVIPHGSGFGNVILNASDGNNDLLNSTLDLNGFNVTINGLSAVVNPASTSGTLALDVISNSGASPATFTVGDNNASGTFGGIIQNGASSTGLTKIGSGTQTLTGINTYAGNTTVNAGTLTVDFSGAIASNNVTVATIPAAASAATLNVNGSFTTVPTVSVNGNGTVGGVLHFAANSGSGILTRTLNSVTIGSSGLVSVASTSAPANRTVLVASSLTNAGKLDLSNNDFIDQNPADAAAIVTELKSGFNSGSGYWNGTGIVSTSAASDSRFLTTLGYRQTDGTISFDGQTPSNGATLVKYTYYGDADLNGTVNGSDYQQIDLGFGSGATGWSNGDFNYDGVVNGSDFALIDNTFNQLSANPTLANPLALVGSPASLIASPAITAVPEPTLLGLLSVGALGLVGRRRRRQG